MINFRYDEKWIACLSRYLAVTDSSSVDRIHSINPLAFALALTQYDEVRTLSIKNDHALTVHKLEFKDSKLYDVLIGGVNNPWCERLELNLFVKRILRAVIRRENAICKVCKRELNEINRDLNLAKTNEATYRRYSKDILKDKIKNQFNQNWIPPARKIIYLQHLVYDQERLAKKYPHCFTKNKIGVYKPMYFMGTSVFEYLYEADSLSKFGINPKFLRQVCLECANKSIIERMTPHMVKTRLIV